MAYKLMAVDIDGTLIDSRDNLTEETKEAIRLGVEKGLIFTISTGRPIQGVEKLNSLLDLDLPFITYNGAMVVMGKSKNILYEQKMSPTDARQVYDLGIKYGVLTVIWKENKLYVSRMDELAAKYSKSINTPAIVAEDVDAVLKDGVTKLLWYDDPKNIERYQNEVGQYLRGDINYHISRPIYLEFVDKNASKAIAMQRLGEHFGISREEMIAVGDGYNDLSMIEYAGLGVAMANAKDEIKKKAKYVTLSNDEDGVAHVIYKFVLGMKV